jgi:mannose-6-phosphate isomerase-like protein (cupin superfamily)
MTEGTTMTGYVTTQEQVLATAGAFRRVLATGKHSQLVEMTLQPAEEIGAEVHDDGDQMFFVLAGGPAAITVGDETHEAPPGTVAVVPAGVLHNVANSGAARLTLLTVYAPPEHPDGLVARTKEEAEALHDH